MKLSIRLQTPLGIGTYQGTMDSRALVRLPVNPTTEPHLRDANCLTKRATASGLWLFSNDEIKAVRE